MPSGHQGKTGGRVERLPCITSDGDIAVDSESAEAAGTRGDAVSAFDPFAADNWHRRLLSR